MELSTYPWYFRKESTDDRWLKIQTLILLYSTKIFCLLMTVYVLLKADRYLPSVVRLNPLPQHSDLTGKIMAALKLRVEIDEYPEKLFNDPRFAHWIIGILAVVIIFITILGIIGISQEYSSLLIPYILYRWLWTIMVTVIFLASNTDSSSFDEYLKIFSCLPTFIGFMKLFIPFTFYIKSSLLIIISEFCIVAFEAYLTYTVVRCYEKILLQQRIQFLQSYEERLRLMFDPPTYYQSVLTE